MMTQNIGLSPPIALCFFLALAYGIYRAGRGLSERGEKHPGKHQPYACGEDLLPPEAQLSYRAFFRLALVFAVLHLATLVVSTLPPGGGSRRLALAYLIGIGVSVFVLTDGDG